MPISWNEIRHNAIRFSRDWTGAKSESAEKQTFWNEFFEVFGVSRRAVASFEEPVKKISGDYGYIDLFWPRIVLVEHKSAGKDLGKAESQAFRYIQDLAREGRHQEIPRYVIVSDFNRIALHDLEPEVRPWHSVRMRSCDQTSVGWSDKFEKQFRETKLPSRSRQNTVEII
jgi:hypothetical protein